MKYALASILIACAGLAQAQCRQALALAIDVSGSVDSDEYAIQANGLSAALTAPEVVDRLLLLPDTPVALAVYEWSGAYHQFLIQPWIEIRSMADIQTVTTALRTNVRDESDPGTALGIAMQYGLDLLAQRPDCWAHTLDISGDGKSNTGPDPRDVRTGAGHVTINGLVIGEDLPPRSSRSYVSIQELTAYYHVQVKHGPLAFLETALGFEDIERAMTRKLLRELEFQQLSLLDQ